VSAPADAVLAAVEAVGGQPLPDGVAAMAAHAAARFGPAAASVLFYGSCLRARTTEGILDFYVLVDGYRAAYGRFGLAAANAILPPNVFYLEAPLGERMLRAKVAVMTVAAFARAVAPGAFMPTVWARFCQPAVVAWARGPDEAREARALLARAVVTAAVHAVPLAPAGASAQALWTALFAATYRAELRAEGGGRAADVVAAWPGFYAAVTAPAIVGVGEADAASRARARRAWALRRVLGKVLNALRLVKALYTFEGGVDYVLWKIERHTGRRPAISPWQRRHPLLALPCVAWRLYRQGVLR